MGGSELCGLEDRGLEVWITRFGMIEDGVTEVGRIAVAMALLSSELLITEEGVPEIPFAETEEHLLLVDPLKRD